MMSEPIDKISTKYVAVNKDTKFEKGDFITFTFIGPGDEVKDLSTDDLMGLVDRVEDRYVTIIFSHEPIKNGVVSILNLNRRMVVKMNGYSSTSILSKEGVTLAELPLADVVNMAPSIIIKNMMERK
jgi:hypothetical protein